MGVVCVGGRERESERAGENMDKDSILLTTQHTSVCLCVCMCVCAYCTYVCMCVCAP